MSGTTTEYTQAGIDSLLLGKVDKSANGTDFANAATTRANLGAASRVFTSVATKTANYTLALGDAYDTLLVISSTSGLTLTVPLHSTVALPVGCEIPILRYNTGSVTVAAASGATLHSATGTYTLRAQYSAGTILQVATDTWVLSGDLT